MEIVLIVLAVFACLLPFIAWAGISRMEDKSSVENREEVLSWEPTEEFLHSVIHRTDDIEDQVGQLYRHLNLVYRKVPTHGEVTILPLSQFGAATGPATGLAKSTRERSA